MIFIGADHGGFKLKKKIKDFLQKEGYEYDDLGNVEFDPEDDYPDYAIKVSEKVAEHEDNKGILLCRSSGGMVIAANKVKGVRAVAAFDIKAAKHAREHNNANVLAISGDWTSEKDAKKIIKAFLETDFTDEDRHKRRLEKIDKYEKSN